DLIIRGAGPRNSRELTLALDNLGLDRDESVGSLHMRFWGATLARNLAAALQIYADILRRPHLPADQLDAVKALAFQELQSIEDEPKQKVLIELRRRHYPAPLGQDRRDRKSTRLNSSHVAISYAVFCLKKKTKNNTNKKENSTATTTLQ